MKDARRAVILAMKDRLKNLVRDVSTSRKSINRDRIKMTNENYDSRRIKSATNSNSKLRTLSSSLLSSSKVNLKEKKKNKREISVVFFFSKVLKFVKEREKNRKTIFVDLFFDRSQTSSSLTSSSAISESLIRLLSSLSSAALKKLVVISRALMNRFLSSTETRCDEQVFTLIHRSVSSSVLSFVSLSLIAFAFASSFSAFIDFASPLNVLRSHKRIRAAFSSTFKKRMRSANERCDCTLSAK